MRPDPLVKSCPSYYHKDRSPPNLGAPRSYVRQNPGVWSLCCTYCGNLRIEGARYCQNCGRLVDAANLPIGGVEPSREARPSLVPWRGGQVALGILFIIIAIIPVTAIAIGVGHLVEQYDQATTTWVSVHLMALAISGVVWRFGVYRSPAPFHILGLSPVRLPRLRTGPGIAWLADNALFLTVVALGASLVFTVAYGTVVEFLDVDILSPDEIDTDIAFPGVAAVLTFQALSLVTPLTEEVFFRGFVFRGLTPRLGVGWAIVGSAVIFSIFHLSIGVLIPIFVTGLLLGWLYHRTGSLWPCILAHAGQNTLAVAMEVYWV